MLRRRRASLAGSLCFATALAGAIALPPSAAQAASPVTVTVSPTADTYGNQGAPTTNFGTASSMATRGGNPGYAAYLRFVLPTAPAGTTLTGASLRLRTSSETTGGSADSVAVRVASDAWSESTLTWNNRPAATGAMLGTITGATAINTTYTTALDPSALSPLLGSQQSVALVDAGTDSLWLWTINHPTASYRPLLTLTFDTVADVTPPSTPTGVTATVTASNVALDWTASTDNTGVTGYQVHRSTVSGFTPSPATLIATVSGTHADDLALADGTYYYRVIAVDAAANSSGASTETPAVVFTGADVTAPSVPTGLAASAPGTSMTLTWTPATDDVGVTGYDVYRTPTSGGAGGYQGTTATPSFGDPRAAPGTWYYRVIAFDAAGNHSAASSELAVTLAAGGTPTTSTLTATADTYGNQGAPTTNFGTASSLATRGGNPGYAAYLRFVLPSAPAGTVLTGASLRLRTSSETTGGTADSVAVRVASDAWSETTLTWNNRPAASGAVLGTITGATSINTTYLTTLDVNAVTPLLGSQQSVALVDPGADSLWVWTINHPTASYRPALVLTFASSVVADNTPPTAPSGLAADVSGSTVKLHWTASTDAVGVTGYDVYRSPDPVVITPANRIATTTTPSLSDHNLAIAGYHYRVVAFDAAGNRSDASDDLSVAVTSAPDAINVFAVGDIACPPGSPVTATTCRQADVAAVATAYDPDYFIAVGDIQYDNATIGQFRGPGGYDTYFGSLLTRTLPVVGNHEYTDPAGPAKGYFNYFDPTASGVFGAPPSGYYTKTIGSWRFIALNSECAPDGDENANQVVPGGCDVGSPQYQWLQNVLSTSTQQCTLVAFHRSRWSTGSAHGSYGLVGPMWDLMAANGVDVVVSGHNHGDEVFTRIGASGTGTTPNVDPLGIRSFVAGEGGEVLYPFNGLSNPVGAAEQARDNTSFGGLSLTLRDGSFDWAYLPIAGKTLTNVGTSGAFSGTGEACH